MFYPGATDQQGYGAGGGFSYPSTQSHIQDILQQMALERAMKKKGGTDRTAMTLGITQQILGGLPVVGGLLGGVTGGIGSLIQR